MREHSRARGEQVRPGVVTWKCIKGTDPEIEGKNAKGATVRAPEELFDLEEEPIVSDGLFRLIDRAGLPKISPWPKRGRYEFLCEKCKKRFELIMTISEREKGEVKCPKCRGTKITPRFGGFVAQTAKKSCFPGSAGPSPNESGRRYLKPSWLVGRMANPLVMRLGIVSTLAVRDRASGEWRTVSVDALELERQRCLVAPRGDTQVSAIYERSVGDSSVGVIAR